MLLSPFTTRSSFLSILARLGLVLALLVVAPVLAAHAATYDVSNTNDSGPGSLREAITNANTNPGHDTITFSTSGTITLGSALPQIADDLTVTGPGAGSLSISGANSYQVFYIAASTAVTITSMTIRDGNAASGGGIYIL